MLSKASHTSSRTENLLQTRRIQHPVTPQFQLYRGRPRNLPHDVVR